MAENTDINAGGNTDVPAMGNGGTPSGDGSTPTQTIDSFEKIDPSKLSEAELKHYKFFQGHFTKATQKYAEKERELSGKLSDYEMRLKSTSPLLDNDVVKPFAYYAQHGSFPEGFDPTPYAKLLGIEQQDPNAQYVAPEVKSFLDSELNKRLTPLQQENAMLKNFVQKETVNKVGSVIDSYKADLAKQDPKLVEMFEQFKSNGKLSEALAKTPFSENHKERLENAFNMLSAKEYIPYVKEKTRAQTLEELKKKSETNRPLEGGSSGSVVKATNAKDLRALLAEKFDEVGQ